MFADCQILHSLAENIIHTNSICHLYYVGG